MSEQVFPVRVVQIRYEATDVLSFTLQAPDDTGMPPVEPGSHVDVHLPNALMRSYSLSNGTADRGTYRLTVARDANSKGGSSYIHDSMRVGQIIEISKPRNTFALAEDAQLTVFFAGGIGVTPFVPMICRLNDLGRPWRLHYAVRTPDRAALLTEIEELASAGGGEVLPNYDELPGGRMLDLPGLIAGLPKYAHVYCCGPGGMLDAFRKAADAAGLPAEHVHFEYFSSTVSSATEGGFTVVLARSGAELLIVPGQSILHAVNAFGLNVPYSCEEGVCAACETRVIEGKPDHRDMILSEREREEGRTMMICCSGSKSERLVLDL